MQALLRNTFCKACRLKQLRARWLDPCTEWSLEYDNGSTFIKPADPTISKIDAATLLEADCVVRHHSTSHHAHPQSQCTMHTQHSCTLALPILIALQNHMAVTENAQLLQRLRGNIPPHSFTLPCRVPCPCAHSGRHHMLVRGHGPQGCAPFFFNMSGNIAIMMCLGR